MKRIEITRVALVGLVIGVLLILPYFWILGGFKRIAILGVATAIYLILCLPSLKVRYPASTDLTFRIIKICFAVFFVGKCIRDFLDSSVISNPAIAIFEVTVYCLLVLIAWTSAKRVFEGKATLVVSAWAFGIAIYAGVNFIGSIVGIGQESGAASSLVSETRTRMQIPFGPGLNLFGVVAASGGVLALEALKNSLNQRVFILLALNISAFLVNWIVVVLVETRSVILPVVIYFIWNVFKARGLRIGLSLASVGVLLLTPVLGGMTGFFSTVADLIPSNIQNALSRSADDLKEFGGRTVIWEYAFQELKAGNIKLFGDGQLERDTRPLFHLLFRYMPESNTTYHNGFIDLIFVYGPPLALLGSLTLIMSMIWSGVLNSSARYLNRTGQAASAGLLISVSLCTLLESSMTLNHFWIILAVLLALQSDCRDVPKGETTQRSLEPKGLAITPRPVLG